MPTAFHFQGFRKRPAADTPLAFRNGKIHRRI